MAWLRKLSEHRTSGAVTRATTVGANSLLRRDLVHRTAAALARLTAPACLSSAVQTATLVEDQTCCRPSSIRAAPETVEHIDRPALGLLRGGPKPENVAIYRAT